jgi:hypothetical protein
MFMICSGSRAAWWCGAPKFIARLSRRPGGKARNQIAAKSGINIVRPS